MDYGVIFDLAEGESEPTINNDAYKHGKKKQSQSTVTSSSFNWSSKNKKRNCQKCKHCDYHSKETDILARHMKEVHAEIRRFQCQTCDYSAKMKQHLQVHIPVCKKRISKDLPKNSLQKKSKATTAKKLACETCLETFTSNKILVRHMQENGHHKGTWFKCNRCKRVFMNQTSLDQHCRICGFKKCKVCCKMVMRTNLASHMRHHQRESGGKKEVDESAILFQIKHALQGKQRPKSSSNGLTSDKYSASEGRETINNHDGVVGNISQIVQNVNIFANTAKSTCLNVENERENKSATELFLTDFGDQSCSEATQSSEESSPDFDSQSRKEQSPNASSSEEEDTIPYFCTWCSKEGDEGFTTEEMQLHLREHHNLTLLDYCELNCITFCT